MTIKKLSSIINDESYAESFLQQVGILKTFDTCPECSSSHLGRVRRGKYKCYECKAEWNLRKDSYLERKKITLSDFVACMKFFVDGMNATKCAIELEVSPKLTRRIFDEFREILLGAPKRMRENPTHTSFFITSRNGKIVVEHESKSKRNDSVSKLAASRAIDEDRCFFYKFEYKNLNAKKLESEISRIDELDDFYRYIKERILNFRGRDLNAFFIILQELSFRYNYKHDDIFSILVNKLSIR